MKESLTDFLLERKKDYANFYFSFSYTGLELVYIFEPRLTSAGVGQKSQPIATEGSPVQIREGGTSGEGWGSIFLPLLIYGLFLSEIISRYYNF